MVIQPAWLQRDNHAVHPRSDALYRRTYTVPGAPIILLTIVITPKANVVICNTGIYAKRVLRLS